MSMRYKGSRLSATANTPTSLTASGAWTLQQQMQANGTSTWPFVRDPQFNYVTMLLHGDGSAGANNGSGGGATPTVTAFNTDASTNNFNVTINGDARSNNFNPYQSGYYSNYFDGTGDYLSTPSSAAFAFSGNFTVEAWVYLTANIANSFGGYVTDFRGSSVNDFALGFIGTSGVTKMYAYKGDASPSDLTGTTTVSINTWNHVAYVRSGTTVTIYLNGVANGTYTVSQAQTTTSVVIGARYTGSTEFVPGYISNLRIVNGTAVYTSNFTPSTTPLTAITNTSLLTCQSNRFIDNSTNNFTITKNGDTAISPAQPFTLPSSVATYGSGYFDGSGDYLSVPSNAAFQFGSGDFTIECWAYMTSAAQQFFFSQWNSPNRSWGFLVRNSGTTLSFVYSTTGSNETSIDGTIAAQAGRWAHFAAVRSGNTLTTYMNGVSVATASMSGVTLYSASQAVEIGRNPESGAWGFTGYMGDVRVVKGTAITPPVGGPTSPLTAVSGTALLTTQYNGGGNNSGFKDSSQFNFPITRNGNTTQGTFTPYGSNWSNAFTASSGSYLSVPYSSAFNLNGDFTVECWINPSQLPTATSTGSPLYPRIFSFGTYNAANSIGLELNSNDPGRVNAFSIWYNGTQSYSANSLVAVGNWYHCAMVRSGTVITLYLNGTSILTITGASAAVNTSQAFYIASLHAFESTADACFKGNISNLRIVKGTAVYTAAFTPPTTPLTAISGTSLLTCADNRFVDDSTNNFTVTANGTPSVQRFSPFANATAYNPATTGGSGYFGSANYLSAASNVAFGFGTGDFTVEAWVYPNAAYTTYNYIWATGVNDGLVVYVSSGVLYARAYNVIDLLASSVAPALNAWSHVAVTRSGTTLRIFVNGVQTGTTTNSTNFATGSGLVGNDGTNAAPWYGYISDLRVVKGTALYTGNFTPPTAPLTPTANTSLLLSNTNSAILDQSMMNDLQTVGNAQISTSVVKYGTASMYFDGTGDGLFARSTPDSAFGTGDFTVEFWLNLAANLGSFVKIVMLGTTGNCFTIETQSTLNLLAVTNKNSTVYFYSSTALTTGTWIHVAVSRSSGTMRLFQNGTQVGSAANTVDFPNAGGLYIGRSDVGQEMNGYIDDLRITKYARYTTTFTPPTQALPNG